MKTDKQLSVILCGIHIPVGKENAVPRAELQARFGLPDRKMRHCIEAARNEGMLICNDMDGKGYYIADKEDIESIYKQYKQDTNRALRILARRKAERKILKAAGVKV